MVLGISQGASLLYKHYTDSTVNTYGSNTFLKYQNSSVLALNQSLPLWLLTSLQLHLTLNKQLQKKYQFSFSNFYLPLPTAIGVL